MSARHILPQPSLEQDAEALHQALSDLVRLYQFRDRDRICCHDISVTQCYALEAVIERGPLSLNALAAELYLDKSTASRVVSALERKGYIARREHSGDAREIELRPTAAGRRLYATIRRNLVEEEKRLLGDLSPEIRREAARLITRLAQAAARRMGRGQPACCAPRE